MNSFRKQRARVEIELLEVRDVPAASMLQVANIITHSAEFDTLAVNQMYQNLLGRSPDLSEMTGWTTALAGGVSIEQAEAGFLSSPEYLQDHGGAGQNWLQSLYQNVLDRSPAPAEVDGWLHALDEGISAGQVAIDFTTSAEHIHNLIVADYQTFLLRTPGAQEVAGWTQLSVGGMTDQNIAALFVSSAEYFALANHGNYSTWVINVYDDVLKRSPSDPEITQWLIDLGVPLTLSSVGAGQLNNPQSVNQPSTVQNQGAGTGAAPTAPTDPTGPTNPGAPTDPTGTTGSGAANNPSGTNNPGNSGAPVNGPNPAPVQAQPPTIQLQTPTTTVTGSTFNVTVTATPGSLALAGSAKLQIDGVDNGFFNATNATTYTTVALDDNNSATITVAGLTNGTYALRAVAADTQGNVATATGTVTVSITPTNVLPLAFEPNRGQADPSVLFLTHAKGYNLYLTDNSMDVIGQVGDTSAEGLPTPIPLDGSAPPPNEGLTSPLEVAQQIQFVNASTPTSVQGQGLQTGVSNYFIGNDPSQWVHGVANYGSVIAHDLYPGVDLTLTGAAGNADYGFVVEPGASMQAIQLQFVDSELGVGSAGQLTISTPGGATVVQAAPVFYQTINGRRVVFGGSYVQLSSDTVGFTVTGNYNPSLPLVIDPTVVFETYLGGSNADSAQSIAVDTGEQAVVVGTTDSPNYPVLNTFTGGGTFSGNQEVAITKFNGAGTALLFSDYFGGNGTDHGNGVALDSSNNIYVTGEAGSTNLPTTPGAFQTTNAGGGGDAFVLKLSADGSTIDYSTYLGGTAADLGNGIVVDSTGAAYVLGTTSSTNFPTTAGAFQSTLGGGTDCFVTKLNPTGSALTYSTYVGTSSTDTPLGIALNSTDDAYICGWTNSLTWPTTAGAFQVTRVAGAGTSGFVTELNFTGTQLLASTNLGGTLGGQTDGVAVDASGIVYATGFSGGTGLRGTAGAFATAPVAAVSPYVIKLNASLSTEIFGTYYGGSGIINMPTAIAVDGSGDAYIVGQTNSTNLPTVNPIQANHVSANNPDGFVAVFNRTCSSLLFASTLGGSAIDSATDVALDSSNNIYVSGTTTSTDFPVTPGAFQTTNGGLQDGFVVKIGAIVAPGGGGGIGSGTTVFLGDLGNTYDNSDKALQLGTFNGTVTYTGMSIENAGGIDEQDFFRWTMESGGPLTVAILSANNTGPIQFYVYRVNANNTLTDIGAGINYSGSLQTATMNVTAGENVIVYVFGFNFATGRYLMTLALT